MFCIKALEGDEDSPEPEPQPTLSPPKPAPPSGSGSSKSPQKGTSGGKDVQVVSDRLELYKQAVQQAEGAGEGAKARRYKRSLANLEQVHVIQEER